MSGIKKLFVLKKGKIKMKIAIIIILCVYVAFNIVTSNMIPAAEMKRRYIDGQCVVGRIAANVFYFPAWLLKGLKIGVNFLVK